MGLALNESRGCGRQHAAAHANATNSTHHAEQSWLRRARRKRSIRRRLTLSVVHAHGAATTKPCFHCTQQLARAVQHTGVNIKITFQERGVTRTATILQLLSEQPKPSSATRR